MADAAPHWTPFRYGFSNPIVVTDPTGMAEEQYLFSGGAGGSALNTTAGTGTVTPIDGAWTRKVSSFYKEPKQASAPGITVTPDKMASIDVTKTPLAGAVATPNISLPAIQEIAEASRDQVRETEPSIWDYVSAAADAQAARGEYGPSMVYNTVNDAYITYNVIVNRQYSDLQNKQIGYNRATTTSVLTVMTSAYGFLAKAISPIMSEVLAAKEGKNIVGTAYDEIKPTQDWINPAKVLEYKSLLQSGEKLDPIITYKNTRGVFIEDGHHRFAAYMELGIKPNIILRNTGGPVGFPNWLNTIFQVPPLGH